MKDLTLRTAITAGIAIVVLCSTSAFAASAPPYPGPTLKGERVEQTDSGEGYSKTVVWDVYYAKDSRAKVVAFYKQKGFKVIRDDQGDTVLASPGAADWAVVVHTSGNDSDFFGPLEDEVMQQGGMQAAGLVGTAHTRKDLEAVKAKYGFLATEAFIPDGSISDRLSACEDRINAEMDNFNDESESIDQKMQQLAMQGRYDAMQKLANQRMAQGMGGSTASHWDAWIACYEALARDAYRSEIRIRVR